MFGKILLGTTVAALLVSGLVHLGQAPETRADRPAPPIPPIEEKQEGLARPEVLRREKLPPDFEVLNAFAVRKKKPGPHDWLAQHREDGQSYAEWQSVEHVRVTPERRYIYLQPLGSFSPAQQKVVDETADYVERYFGVPVRMKEPLPMSLVPAWAKRSNPNEGQRQLLTQWVLSELVQRRPDDALAYIALTPVDLYPEESWNFVYGQATLQHRVGVWSMWRFGDPAKSDKAFGETLHRTISTSVHELGHMLTIAHCIAWECVMNGINHDEEAMAAPLEPCPADLAKLCEATDCDLQERYDALIEFWERHPTVAPDTLRHLRQAKEKLLAVR